MNRTSIPWPIYSVMTRETKIDPKPPRQRGPVWSPGLKQLFIDSILRGYDIPKLYLNRVNRPPYEYEVIDGQQRLRAIWGFARGDFPLDGDAAPVMGQEVAGRTYTELNDDVKDLFHGYALDFVIFQDTTDAEMDDMFIRLNEGVPLNAAEKRNAITGNMRDFAHELASAHDFFVHSIPFDNRRYIKDELAAQMILIELNGGITTAGHRQLRNMYETHRAFKTESPKAVRIKTVLNFLKRAFPNATGELSKVSSLSLYAITSQLLAKYAFSGKHQEFQQWFLDFESRRRQDEQLDTDRRDPDLVQYQLYLTQGTASQTGLEHRNRVLMGDILNFLPNLQLLDDQRVFDEYQRLAIYRRYNGTCANPNNNPECALKCEWDSFHADHIVPWSAGGKTTVSNGQLLCPSCNLKKGKVP